jgi:DNA-binding FadR family transcriptional regulator
MPLQYDKVVTQSLAKQIAENIRDAIISGDLQVDERLPTEDELAAKFKVSRPTVREALKRLAAQNLIRSQRGPTGGTFVNRPSAEEVSASLTTATTLLVSMGEFSLEEIAEARRELELLCCKLAVAHRDDSQLDRMAAQLERQREPDLSDEDFCAADVAFHRALADASGNPVLRFVMFAVIEALQPISNMLVFRFRERDKIIDQHQRLLDAVRAQDEAEALSVLGEQMDYLREQHARAQAWRDQSQKSPN